MSDDQDTRRIAFDLIKIFEDAELNKAQAAGVAAYALNSMKVDCDVTARIVLQTSILSANDERR